MLLFTWLTQYKIIICTLHMSVKETVACNAHNGAFRLLLFCIG